MASKQSEKVSNAQGASPVSGTDILVEALLREGVRVVAGMPGGANLPLYDALGRSRLAGVLVRHEQAAGFIAEGLARASGSVGVCFATSGPGATNLLTALADAHRDSVPILAVTGQVPRGLIGTDAFQEIDICALARPITKAAIQVQDVAEVSESVHRALALARGGRPGPVLLDMPKDVQQATASPASGAGPRPCEPLPQASEAELEQALSLLRAARRPVLYVGGGLGSVAGAQALRAFAERCDIPVAASLMGLGLLPAAHPLWLGMLGMHAAPYTNLVLSECDLLLAIGVRFDDRATGRLSAFCPGARVVHVDIDARELGKLRRPELAVRADGATTLAALTARAPAGSRRDWRRRVDALRCAHPLAAPTGGLDSAPGLIEALAQLVDDRMLVTTDVGQHQMWVAQRLNIRSPRRLLTSGGLGAMGFGLPAAIGAALGTGHRTLCVTGDGSLMLSLPELATLVEQRLPVTVLVLDNGQLGLVRQQQHLFYGGRYASAHFARRVDFVAAARAFGLEATRLPFGAARRSALAAALSEASAAKRPSLIHAQVSECDDVLPMVPPGAANHEMLTSS